MASPYDVLRVDPDADREEIKEAYRERVKEAHPDHGGSPAEFQRVRSAYEDLKAGIERTEYDVGGEAGEAASTNGATASEAATAAEPEPEPEPEPGPTEPDGAHVEYLNYEVLDDHGWQLTDDDLFEKAAEADLDPADYGEFVAAPDDPLLQSAEDEGYAWPYACRGGACANCAVAMYDGDLSLPVDHILNEGMVDRGIRLSCVGTPESDDLRVVFNVKHLPGLDELRLPPRPFEGAQTGD